MRIALVCPYSWTRPGGVQSHVRGLPRELRRRGHHVDVIAPADRRVAAKSVHVVGPSVPIPDNGSLVPVALTPLAPLRVARLLRARRYEVVHVHEPMIPAVSLSALASASGPLVGTFHMYATRPRWYQTFARLCRTMLGRLDVRIAVSEPARWHVRRICPGDYRIIPNGIDTERYARQRPMGRGSRIVFIGRAERRKGLAVLVDAVARLPAGVELDVVGAGVDAVDPGGRQRVHAHGRVSDEARDRLLTRADVLCVPSLEGESFGIVVLEGMAAGLPVVASELPGYAELLPRSAGRLVPPGDPVALADALREILEDADLREHMGRAGYEAARRYDWRRVADEVLEAYRDALAVRSRTAPQVLGRRRVRHRIDDGLVRRRTTIAALRNILAAGPRPGNQ
jgi:phosphatidylinositol alpha-mannosyltransferase